MTNLNLLISELFKEDPRLTEAKKLILDTLKDYQQRLTGIRPPIQERVQTYESVLNEFSVYRGGKLYFPYIGSGMGNGSLVELLDGSIKYDMISGIGSHFWGHHHPDIVEVALNASISNTVMQGHLQQNIDSLELSRTLIQASGLDHCFLTSSGVMANENALKIAFQNKYPADRILAFEKCFMGRTLAMSQITDKPAYREGLPLNVHVDYIPFYQFEHPEESTEKAVKILKQFLSRYPKRYAAMCFEMVQGENGFYPGSREFFLAIMKVLKKEGIAILIDEVQTFGRTSALFAYQHFELEDYVDLVTIGKLSQVCATLYRKEFKPRPGLLSQTFTSSTIAIRTGQFIVKSLLEGNYYGKNGKIEQIHQHFIENFKEIERRHPQLICGPYGIGGMIAFTPFNGELDQVTQFIHKLFQAGVISFFAGSHPTRVRFLVPIGVITPNDIAQVTSIVEKTLVECKSLTKNSI